MPPTSFLARLLLLSPALLAIHYLVLSPISRATQPLLDPLCVPSPSGRSSPTAFAPQGVRNDWWAAAWLPNELVCPLVVIFEAAAFPPRKGLWSTSLPPSRVLVMLWMSYIPTILTIIHLTAHRHRKSWLPPVMGVYQWFSSALCTPLIGCFVVPRLLPARSPLGRPYSRASVEGLIFGLIAGYLVPSRFLLFSTGEKRQEWVAGWQFLPLWVWVGQEGWKVVRRAIDGPGERRAGKVELSVLGGLLGVSSLMGHGIVLRELFTHGPLRHLLPPLHTPALPSDLTYLAGSILGYDLLITHLSVVMIVVYLSSSAGGGRGGSVLASTARVLLGTAVGGLGVGVGVEWWKYGGGAQ